MRWVFFCCFARKLHLGETSQKGARIMQIIDTEKLPVYVWTDQVDEADGVFQQARNLANHPIVRHRVGLMPDFHLGYGMPIGGGIATAGGGIPNAVGVDA